MSSTGYITFPQQTDARDLMATAFAYLQTKVPGWSPAEGNLDAWIIESYGSEAADIQTLATQVPKSVFRYLGAKLFDIPPISAVSAIVNSTWTSADLVGHTITAGTHVGIRDADGNLIGFSVLSDVIIPGGTSVTADGAVVLIADTPGASPNGIGADAGPIELIDSLSWAVNPVIQSGVVANGVDAELDDDYLDRLSQELQSLSPRPILPIDFSILARKIAGVQRAVTIDGYNPFHNYLTANEASAETDASGWASKANTTVASTAAQAADGIKSVQMTAASAADMSIHNTTSYACVAGETMSAIAFFRSAVTARSCKVGIEWRDVSDTILSTVYGGASNDATAAWTECGVSIIAPASAAKARVVCYVTAPANAEVHYVDKISLRQGFGADWVPGGTIETGNAKMVATYSLDVTGAGVNDDTKAAVSAYLESLRELNFKVNAGDPSPVRVAISTTIISEEGYSPTDVSTRVSAAVQNFLSQATWGISSSDNPNDPITFTNTPSINYVKLATVIGRVGGVGVVTELLLGLHGTTLEAADCDMSAIGVVPLPFLGSGDLDITVS